MRASWFAPTLMTKTGWALLINNLAGAGRGQETLTAIPGRLCARYAKWAAGRGCCSKLGEQRRHQPHPRPIGPRGRDLSPAKTPAAKIG